MTSGRETYRQSSLFHMHTTTRRIERSLRWKVLRVSHQYWLPSSLLTSSNTLSKTRHPTLTKWIRCGEQRSRLYISWPWKVFKVESLKLWPLACRCQWTRNIQTEMHHSFICIPGFDESNALCAGDVWRLVCINIGYHLFCWSWCYEF